MVIRGPPLSAPRCSVIISVAIGTRETGEEKRGRERRDAKAAKRQRPLRRAAAPEQRRFVRRLVVFHRPLKTERALDRIEIEKMVRASVTLLKDAMSAGFARSLSEILVCPLSKQPLRFCEATNSLISGAIGVSFPIKNGIPRLVPKDGKILGSGGDDDNDKV
ncbi:hypothetical protein NL676_006419 [Syzygium grande]|nr:hypothetical protein NL676_006419 [Syzygium grande]